MPAKAKKFLITTETHEICIVRRNGRDTVRGNCALCGREVEMLTIDLAVTVTGIRSLELFRMLEAGRLHYVESEIGHMLICEPSIMHATKSGTSTSQPQFGLVVDGVIIDADK
jgi:hypothetical protein